VITPRAVAALFSVMLLLVAAACSPPRPAAQPGHGIRSVHAEVRGIT
jgi:hypothetical protein